ncbi:hypothetical protein ARV1_gp41 [Acidianus rod-shaped virus 1]|uniref:Uncharacterized protein n=1 Tax=Acidianus rod-shaped virus 1 TaxID=309181 RepID=Q50I30_9VIRU|nr:hypothetical protein ARV1_gp01 [Acidianus rod-shaped virus 1]YP_001542658.1 hypothetical protein ARV1_gp41 [Acidianus rod-shaped virus 1]CAI44156.1 hypothetical protein [Acidianus rod-shaped virus 1]CAI44196.1 hypothetical protein [Acidianus rod-shaped virus 1]
MYFMGCWQVGVSGFRQVRVQKIFGEKCSAVITVFRTFFTQTRVI